LDAPSPFFDQPDLAFDFRDMFLRRRGVDRKDRHAILELLKLIVHQDRAHLKSSASVEVYHPGDTKS
jgi:hypothetical protein